MQKKLDAKLDTFVTAPLPPPRKWVREGCPYGLGLSPDPPEPQTKLEINLSEWSTAGYWSDSKMRVGGSVNNNKNW